MIIVSGIQPSGQLHLGNYFGAIRQHIALQDQGEAYFFIADYHALTTIRNADVLRRYTYDIAAAYLSLGLNPDKAVLFRQSDVPEVTELNWILATVASFGLLARNHAFKEKVQNKVTPSVGLFTYPILMAAYILIYQAECVPVGEDQLQHVEIAKSIATAFNSSYEKKVFEKPEAVVSSASKVPGTDGQKMSKTYRNIIPIFDADPTWKNAVSRIVTDGKDYTKEPLTVENETVFALYSLMASQDEVAQMLDDYVNNRSFGYGHAKQRLLKKIEDTFGEANRKFGLYKRNQDDLDSILTKGAEKARIKARATLELVRETVGLNHAIK